MSRGIEVDGRVKNAKSRIQYIADAVAQVPATQQISYRRVADIIREAGLKADDKRIRQYIELIKLLASDTAETVETVAQRVAADVSILLSKMPAADLVNRIYKEADQEWEMHKLKMEEQGLDTEDGFQEFEADIEQAAILTLAEDAKIAEFCEKYGLIFLRVGLSDGIKDNNLGNDLQIMTEGR